MIFDSLSKTAQGCGLPLKRTFLQTQVLMGNHEEKEAIIELTKAITFKADFHLLHLCDAFYESISDISGALRDCRAVLSLDPNHSEIMELHSHVHSQEP
ncbi:unnamed protein product [Victoria cruziana]